MKITALRKTWISGASLATVLLVSGLSPVEARVIADDHTAAHAEERQVEPSRDAGDVIDDTWITTKVKSSLLADDDVSGLDIAVETRGHVVYLTGHAETEAQKAHATALASGIEGVSRVDTSALRVEGTRRDASRRDTSGQARGAAGMDRERDYDDDRDMDDDLDDEIAEEGREARGEARDAGEAVGDSWITTKVKSQLLADDEVSGLDVSVETRDNVVYLTGEADSQAQVTRATQLARETDGVTRVDATGLRVETATGQMREAVGMDRYDRDPEVPEEGRYGDSDDRGNWQSNRDRDHDDGDREAGEVIDDSWITTKVKSKLLADGEVSGFDISVETRDNVVHLSGAVENQAQVQEAVRLAAETEGVARVDASGLVIGDDE